MSSTRTEEECIELANRQAKGEDLGFTDRFVKTWATVPVKGAKAEPAKAEPAKAEPAKAEPAKAEEKPAKAAPAKEAAPKKEAEKPTPKK